MNATRPFIVCWTTFGPAAYAFSSQPWIRRADGSSSSNIEPASNAAPRRRSSRRETAVTLLSPARRILGRVVLREHVVRPFALLPLRHRGFALGLRHEARARDERVLVDVARAVRKDLGGADPSDELGPRVFGQERIGILDGGDTIESHALPPLEVDEEQTNLGVDEHVSSRQVHPVPVVDREGDRVLVEDADETGLTSLVRALRLPLIVRCGDEEHVASLDEAAVVGVDAVADDAALDAIGETARVELVLQLAAAFVVERHAQIFSGNLQDKQTILPQDPLRASALRPRPRGDFEKGRRGGRGPFSSFRPAERPSCL